MSTLTQPKEITIGTKFIPAGNRGKMKHVWTVFDIWKTYDSNGNLVKITYPSEREYLGCRMVDYDFIAITIQKGRID